MESIMQMVPFLLIFVVMYFLVIRPQSKQAKELEKLRNEIKEGDTVITSGGIWGKVQGFEDTAVKLKVDGSTVIKVERISITSVKKA